MPTYTNLRLYASVKATEELKRAHDESDTESIFKQLADYTRGLLQKAPYDSFDTKELVKDESFSVVGIPSEIWEADFVGDDDPDLDLSRTPPAELIPDERLIVYQFKPARLVRAFPGRRGRKGERRIPMLRYPLPV